MTVEENRNINAPIATEEIFSEDDVSVISTSEAEKGEDDVSLEATSDTDISIDSQNEREEYERLIKTRFKALYGEDTQRLINRRFRKYRVMEERYHILEEDYKQLSALAAESERKIKEMSEQMQKEGERIAKETEERVLSDIRARRLRPDENGLVGARLQSRPSVSRLTKSDRARLARRAADGEKISF